MADEMKKVALVADAYKDDDEDDDLPDDALREAHIALAEAEFAGNDRIVLIKETNVENEEGRHATR